MVIPDIQAKPGVPDDHLEWIANYAIEKRPDVIIQIGDWADMPSLSSYDKGKRSYEGRRYVKDCDAANNSLMRFESQIEQHNRTHPDDPYNPRKVITLMAEAGHPPRFSALDCELIGNGLVYIIREYPDKAEHARALLERMKPANAELTGRGCTTDR